MTTIKYGGIIKEESAKGMISTLSIPYLYFKLILENVGNGVAVETKVGIGRKDKTEQEEFYMDPIPLKVGEMIRVGLFADNIGCNSCILGDYELEMLYNDINGNQYRQVHEIKLNYNEVKNKPEGTISIQQRQKFVEVTE